MPSHELGPGLGMLCVYPAMGALTDRFGCRAIASGGALLTMIGTLPLLWMAHAGFSPALMGACLFARGAGQGSTGVPTLSAGYAPVPKERLPLATAAANIVQRVGGPIGTTLLAIVISASVADLQHPVPGAFLTAFAALVGLQLLVLAATTRPPLRINPTAARA